MDRSGKRIGNDRLPDLALHAAKSRNRIWKGGGEHSNWKTEAIDSPAKSASAGKFVELSVFIETDAVNVNVARENIRRWLVADLSGQGDVFVLVVARDKDERIFRAKIARDKGNRRLTACHRP